MDPLQEALQIIDEAAATIQELVAQLQSNGKESQMSKKAEEVALKLGVSYQEASDMIKTAGEQGENIDTLVKAASFMQRNTAFGKVYTEESTIVKTGSVAQDKYLEKEAAILEELGFN